MKSLGENQMVETIDVDLKIKLPLRYYKFFRNLGQLVGRTPEQIITEEVYGMLKSFIRGGGLEAWTDSAMYENAELEDLMEQVEEQH